MTAVAIPMFSSLRVQSPKISHCKEISVALLLTAGRVEGPGCARFRGLGTFRVQVSGLGQFRALGSPIRTSRNGEKVEF